MMISKRVLMIGGFASSLAGAAAGALAAAWIGGEAAGFVSAASVGAVAGSALGWYLLGRQSPLPQAAPGDALS